MKGLAVFSAAILLSLVLLTSAAVPARAQGDPGSTGVPVTTWQNDTHRTGQNLKEGTLVPPLSAINFGQLCNVQLDGQVYAQPLVETNVTIGGTGMLHIFGSGRVCQWRDSRGG